MKINKDDLYNDIEKYIAVNYKEPKFSSGPILFQNEPDLRESWRQCLTSLQKDFAISFLK